MASVDELLESLAAAARDNHKGEFDRLERELLAHYEGGFDGMPEEVYQRYLDVDRHWPIALESSASPAGRTLAVRIPSAARRWIEDLAADADRSLSAVVAACVDAVREDGALEQRVREALEAERGPS